MTEPEPCAESVADDEVELTQPELGALRSILVLAQALSPASVRWLIERLQADLDAHSDGDDTELRAIFGEPVEGRDFTRIDGSTDG